ncbi:MAG: SDR family NAD(P)-dependent oxidoreductase [Ilumatobacteraceae bacterium]
MAAQYDNLFRLDGRKAVVIGAGSGIGREAALALAAHGANVVCADSNGEAAADTARNAAGSTSVVIDVNDEGSVLELADAHSDAEVLLHTPAINVRKQIADYSLDEFDKVIRLNLRSTFHIMQLFGRSMCNRQRGSIITISSIRAATVEPGQGVYAATKSGLESLVRTAAAEFGPSNVRVNAIRPGVVETPLTAQLKKNPEWYSAYAEKPALKRWAQASEMVGAGVFLAGEAATYVTGTTITVDAGWTAVDGRYTPPL